MQVFIPTPSSGEGLDIAVDRLDDSESDLDLAIVEDAVQEGTQPTGSFPFGLPILPLSQPPPLCPVRNQCSPPRSADLLETKS
jgi:hypothetical protein